MTDEPTIDEAVARLSHPARVSGDGWHEYLAYDEEDVRTLLASHASLTADLAEAKRLMKPFAAIGAELEDKDGWCLSDQLVVEAADGPVATIARIAVSDLRALAAFVSNKGDG